MKKIKFIAVFMAMVILLSFFQTTEAHATADLRRQLNELTEQRNRARAQADETQDLLSGIQADINDVVAIMLQYEMRVDEALLALDDTEIALLETQIDLQYAEEDLAEARENYAQQEELFRATLRAMHEQGPVGYLEVLFQATSFADFLVRLEHVRAIARFDQQVLEDMEAAEIRLATSVAALETLLAQYETQLEEQQIALAALEEAVAEHEVALLAMREDEEMVAQLLELERITEMVFQEQMGNVQTQINRIEAEEARQRRLAEERERERQRQADLDALVNFDGQFRWPVPTHSFVNSYFGPRIHPITGRSGQHHAGIDIPAPTGTRIIAAADGIVRTSGRLGGYGTTVIIDHGNGYRTLYAHNSRNRVSVGDHVVAGQHIADVGSTGDSTGPHLHFEIIRNGTPVNPMPYFGR